MFPRFSNYHPFFSSTKRLLLKYSCWYILPSILPFKGLKSKASLCSTCSTCSKWSPVKTGDVTSLSHYFSSLQVGHYPQDRHRSALLGAVLERRVHLLPGGAQARLDRYCVGGDYYHGRAIGYGGASSLAVGTRHYLWIVSARSSYDNLTDLWCY